MRRFCLLVNLGTQTQRLIYPEIIDQTMISVIYRLLHMKFAVGSADEAVQLGLAAFTHHIFLQWEDIKLPQYPFLAHYRNCILNLDLADGASSSLMLWLLMIGAISMFDALGEAWLRDSLRVHAHRCQVRTWKGLQEALKSFMWVGLLDDRPGKQVYDLLYLTRGETYR